MSASASVLVSAALLSSTPFKCLGGHKGVHNFVVGLLDVHIPIGVSPRGALIIQCGFTRGTKSSLILNNNIIPMIKLLIQKLMDPASSISHLSSYYNNLCQKLSKGDDVSHWDLTAKLDVRRSRHQPS